MMLCLRLSIFYSYGDYSFESKNDSNHVPLQAADFLAYESYRHIDNRIVQGVKIHKGKPLEPRGVLRCLLRADDPRYANIHPLDLPLPYSGIWLDKDSITELLAGLNGAFADFPVIDTAASLGVASGRAAPSDQLRKIFERATCRSPWWGRRAALRLGERRG